MITVVGSLVYFIFVFDYSEAKTSKESFKHIKL